MSMIVERVHTAMRIKTNLPTETCFGESHLIRFYQIFLATLDHFVLSTLQISGYTLEGRYSRCVYLSNEILTKRKFLLHAFMIIW